MPLRLIRIWNPVVRAVLRSPAHRLLSRSLLVLEHTSPRSGRRVAIPVLYVERGDVILVLAAVPFRKRWWRTFASPAPATLLVRGRPRQETGRLLDGEARRAALRAYLDRFPRAARALRVPEGAGDAELDAVDAALVAFAPRPDSAPSPPVARMRLYDELAPWFHLLTAPEDYAGEATRYAALALEACPDAATLLELGSGGGNNASHLKRRFACTVTDQSPPMLALSEALNPECEHLLGDMRSLRLDRRFDVVFVHDAVMYLTTEGDLRACVETAFLHTRPGGVALFAPDCTLEGYRPGTSHGGHDGADGRALRYVEWSQPVPEGETAARVDFAILTRERDGTTRACHDAHVFGFFPEATWTRLVREAGFEVSIAPGDPGEEDAAQPVFVGVRPA